MNNDLETILDTCLNQIEEGKTSVDECLARFPEHANQLKPLLLAATTLARGREVVPDPRYRARARAKLSIYMQQHPQHKRISPIFWRFTIGLVTVILLFVASGTTFAQGALPGDALYNWKLTSESVWRITSRDQLGVDLALSNRRMYELIDVSSDQGRRARAVDNYEKLLIQFSTETNEKDQQRIVPILRAQHDALQRAGVSIPELEIYFPR
jgi:hypothetical protein